MQTAPPEAPNLILQVLTSGLVSAAVTLLIGHWVQRSHRNQDVRIAAYDQAISALEKLADLGDKYWSNPQLEQTSDQIALISAWSSFNAAASSLVPPLPFETRMALQKAATGGNYGEPREVADLAQAFKLINAVATTRTQCQTAKITIVSEPSLPFFRKKLNPQKSLSDPAQQFKNLSRANTKPD